MWLMMIPMMVISIAMAVVPGLLVSMRDYRISGIATLSDTEGIGVGVSTDDGALAPIRIPVKQVLPTTQRA
jgi:hypothetical protein